MKSTAYFFLGAELFGFADCNSLNRPAVWAICVGPPYPSASRISAFADLR
jgi:hypothetical protein